MMSQAQGSVLLRMCGLFTDVTLCLCSARRTLITGMASGSIVAFNIDFNRWHYEHQNRYWGGQLEGEEGGEEREREERRERGRCILLCICEAGKPQVLRGRQNKYGTLGSILTKKLTWFKDAAALLELTSSVHTCKYTHVCNHRHTIPWRYTPKPANKIDRLQTGEKKSKSSTL